MPDVRQRGAAPVILLAAGLSLLVLAWVFGNPPGAAPDESSHYVRALGAGAVELIGERFVPTEAQRRAFVEQGAAAARRSRAAAWRPCCGRTSRPARSPSRAR